MEGRCDVIAVPLGQLATRAVEQLVDRLVPQDEPGFDARPAQQRGEMQAHVRRERAAAVGLRAEQDRLPERGDPRHVHLEVELGDVGEQEADRQVGQRARRSRAGAARSRHG
jgi:hypothetical protein